MGEMNEKSRPAVRRHVGGPVGAGEEDLPRLRASARASAVLRRNRWAMLGVMVLMLSAVGAPQVLRQVAGTRWSSDSRPAATLPDDGPPLRPSPAGEFRGITLQLHSYWDGIPYEQYIREIAQTGANTICFAVTAFQENAGANSLFIEYRKLPPVARLEKLIKLAHELGLRVVIMPIVLLENPGTGEWRGKINPPEPNVWWNDYESFVLFFAKVAQATDVEVFMVGSELVSIENQVARWRQLIRKVRKAYAGRLSYSANWDHYKDIEWWGDLDIVGMTVYYDLVGDNKPTLDVLLSAWKPLKEKILDWQKKVKLPIMFTEVGWPSQEGCAREPWNYYLNPTKPDVSTQANCFDAFFKTWAGEKAVAGILIWEWRNHPDQAGGKDDTSYIPTGKPAMKIIRQFFQSPGAWSRTTAPASAPATAPTRPSTSTAPAPTRPARGSPTSAE